MFQPTGFPLMAAALALTGLLLAGCGSTGSSAQLIQSNTAIAEARTQEVLLNVLRAKDGLPPIFTVVDTLRRDVETDAGVSLRVPFGQDAEAEFPLDLSGAGERMNRSYVESLQTQDFYLSISQPITPEQFEALARAGADKVPLLHLVVGRVIVAPLDGRKPLGVARSYLGSFPNDPADTERRRAFLVWLDLLTNESEGFTTCRDVDTRVVSPDRVLRKRDLDSLDDVTDAFRAGLEIRAGEEDYIEVVRRTPDVDFCVQPTGLDGDPGLLAPKSGPLPLSLRLKNAPSASAQNGAIVFTDQAANLRVTYVIRSVLGVFDYLGRLVRAREASAQFHEPYTDAAGRTLFDLLPGPANAGPASVRYRGVTYVLAPQDRSRGPTVVGVVVQLLGLNQSLRRRSALRVEVEGDN